MGAGIGMGAACVVTVIVCGAQLAAVRTIRFLTTRCA